MSDNKDQEVSDNAFYTKQQQKKAAVILGLDPGNTSWFEIVGTLENTLASCTEAMAKATQLLSDYDELHQDVKRLTKELDVVIFNRPAAQASLCDIVAALQARLVACVPLPAGMSRLTGLLVQNVAAKMAEKLHQAELKHGFGETWMQDDWEEVCRRHMMDHIRKGDPVDVANYAAFMIYHGWSTSDPKKLAP